VAIELHENINQVLASAKMSLDLVQEQTPVSDSIQHSADQIDYALHQIKKLYHTLVTPALQDFELTDLIQQMMDELFSEEDVRIKFEARIDAGHPISDDIKLSLYRIAQEHLQIVRTHAAADRLEVRLMAEVNRIQFQVKDNGQGLNLEHRDISIGVRSMENRVKLHEGTFQLNSSSQEGCTLLVILPFA
jgi:signal transduction histidine kinase